MSLHERNYRIAWIGEEGPCDYVLERFRACCEGLGIAAEIQRSTWLDLRNAGDCDRIVLTSNNRAFYPDDSVEELITSGQIVPWGVVTSSWHMGSRRSGAGIITHWQQPWFRWWDYWLAWFFPEVARPGSVVPAGYWPIVTPADFAVPSGQGALPSVGRRLAILSACRSTADMLAKQATLAGWVADAYLAVPQFLSSTHAVPELVVWDDSLLPCLPNIGVAEAVEELIGQLKRFSPSTQLIASLGLENVYLWSSLQAYGCVDLLVKPSAALGLSNLLFNQTAQRQVA